MTVNHDVAGSSPAGGARKKTVTKVTVFFQLNPPLPEEIHLRWMKSLRDEICHTAENKGGFNFIEAQAEDFIRACSDFIVRSTISLICLRFYDSLSVLIRPKILNTKAFRIFTFYLFIFLHFFLKMKRGFATRRG